MSRRASLRARPARRMRNGSFECRGIPCNPPSQRRIAFHGGPCDMRRRSCTRGAGQSAGDPFNACMAGHVRIRVVPARHLPAGSLAGGKTRPRENARQSLEDAARPRRRHPRRHRRRGGVHVPGFGRRHPQVPAPTATWRRFPERSGPRDWCASSAARPAACGVPHHRARLEARHRPGAARRSRHADAERGGGFLQSGSCLPDAGEAGTAAGPCPRVAGDRSGIECCHVNARSNPPKSAASR